MKMNFVVPIICAVLLGYLFASFIFNQYGVGQFTFLESANVYYLQCGSYETEEASSKEIKGVSQKLTVHQGNQYYSYIGMTRDRKVAEQIKKMYQENGVDIYIKPQDLENEDFLNQLDQYDVLLKECNNLDEINSVLKTVLATYDEFIINK